MNVSDLGSFAEFADTAGGLEEAEAFAEDVYSRMVDIISTWTIRLVPDVRLSNIDTRWVEENLSDIRSGDPEVMDAFLDWVDQTWHDERTIRSDDVWLDALEIAAKEVGLSEAEARDILDEYYQDWSYDITVVIENRDLSDPGRDVLELLDALPEVTR